MPDVILVLSRWWKKILAITIAATLLAVVLVLLLPKKYVSIATALPASIYATDKGNVFNANLQQLYSSLGTADDLDRIIGTAHLDTIYRATVDELSLADHYGLLKKFPRERAAYQLKWHTSVTKSEWGELKIKVWDNDRNTAAAAANALLKNLQRLHQDLQNRSNRLVLQKLEETYHRDTTARSEPASTKVQAVQTEEKQVYQKLLSEYRLMVATNPPVLVVVEAAQPALEQDFTERLAYVVVAFFGAVLFIFLLALFTEGKRAGA